MSIQGTKRPVYCSWVLGCSWCWVFAAKHMTPNARLHDVVVWLQPGGDQLAWGS